LHDVAGVYIGDTSAFPTAVGSNPMLTCMALARRTAHAILAATPAGATAGAGMPTAATPTAAPTTAAPTG
ncbi:MAG: hypothetical protein EA340_07250, partial [Nitriliruptor sp.]